MSKAAETGESQDRDGAVTTILLADDHVVVRSGLRMLLESEPDFEVVAEASDTDAAERSVRGHKPDILMLDLNMPGRPTLEAIPDILKSSPNTRIVVLTMQDDPAFAREAMRAGALGYVLKEAADDELISAVRLAAEGKTYMHPRLGAKLAAQSDDDGRASVLTDREREVLKMIALGYTNREIADEFVLSVRTVESHRAHIQQKLDLVSRAELVRYALDNGIIDRP